MTKHRQTFKTDPNSVEMIILGTGMINLGRNNIEDHLKVILAVRLLVVLFMYIKFPHIRTYQNRNLEAVFPKLCTL